MKQSTIFFNRGLRVSRLQGLRHTCAMFLIGASILAPFSSCDKSLDAPMPQALETGELTASKQTVDIDASNPTAEAVTLSWTAFSNSRVAYKMLVSSGAMSDTITIAQNAKSKRFSMAELNTIAVEELDLPISVAANIDFKLLANVTINSNTAESNVIRLSVVPAPTGPAYTRMFIVGNATPNGWNIDAPNEMTVDPTNPFQFKYGAVLNAGEFKIPVATGNWGGDFYMPPTNLAPITGTAVSLHTGGQPDNKWAVTTAGPYKILLNISSTPSINIKPFTPSPTLYMVGDATPAGWNIDAPTPMVMTPGNPYEFTFTGPLTVGLFKVPLATGNWNGDYYMPAADNTLPGNTAATFVPGGSPDYKWKITEAGNYKVTVNQLEEKITIVKQ